MEIQPDVNPRDHHDEPAAARESEASQHISLEALRADQDAVLDGEVADPFER
ncbi:hypothetical protein [Promicromonospora sp. NPDC019610]|uniref:hypothetical protein n=1 Tax=Promicromonospora sp. NPDC019610 TaxID=3364405 RepID=UPI00378D8498